MKPIDKYQAFQPLKVKICGSTFPQTLLRNVPSWLYNRIFLFIYRINLWQHISANIAPECSFLVKQQNIPVYMYTEKITPECFQFIYIKHYAGMFLFVYCTQCTVKHTWIFILYYILFVQTQSALTESQSTEQFYFFHFFLNVLTTYIVKLWCFFTIIKPEYYWQKNAFPKNGSASVENIFFLPDVLYGEETGAMAGTICKMSAAATRRINHRTRTAHQF